MGKERGRVRREGGKERKRRRSAGVHSGNGVYGLMRM